MRKVRANFIEKKIEQAKARGYITIKVEEEASNTGTYLYEIHQASFIKSVFVGDFLFMKGDLYDIKEMAYIGDCDSILKFLILNSKNNSTKDIKENERLSREIAKILPARVIDKLHTIISRVSDVRELTELFDENVSNVVKDTYVDVLMEKGYDVIYMKNPKFNGWFMDKDEKFEVDNINLIPLNRFMLVWNQRGYDMFGYQNRVTTVRTGILITEINKSNVDELLYSFILKIFKIEDGKLVDKFDGEAQEFYDELYNNIYNHDLSYYACVEVQDTLAPLHFIVNSKGVSILETEYEEDLGNKKLRMILHFISENLGKASEEGIDIRVIEKSHIKKGKFTIEERKSTIVKSHIRKYKSGARALVRSHFRSGINYSKGVCITF